MSTRINKKEQETDTGSYNFSGGNKQEAVNQQHDLDYILMSMSRKEKEEQDNLLLGPQWTGFEVSFLIYSFIPILIQTPDPPLNNNLYQIFSRDPN